MIFLTRVTTKNKPCWYLVRQDAAGYIQYFGQKTTIISYRPDLEEWHMRSIGNPSVLATLSAPFHTLAIGMYEWTVYNDDKCQKGEAKIKFTLSDCNQWDAKAHDGDGDYVSKEFTCNSGLCIDLARRCDGVPDCYVSSSSLSV